MGSVSRAQGIPLKLGPALRCIAGTREQKHAEQYRHPPGAVLVHDLILPASGRRCLPTADATPRKARLQAVPRQRAASMRSLEPPQARLVPARLPSRQKRWPIEAVFVPGGQEGPGESPAEPSVMASRSSNQRSPRGWRHPLAVEGAGAPHDPDVTLADLTAGNLLILADNEHD